MFMAKAAGDSALSTIATAAEMRVKEGLLSGIIKRGFHYTTAITYPFETEPYLASRLWRRELWALVDPRTQRVEIEHEPGEVTMGYPVS